MNGSGKPAAPATTAGHQSSRSARQASRDRHEQHIDTTYPNEQLLKAVDVRAIVGTTTKEHAGGKVRVATRRVDGRGRALQRRVCGQDRCHARRSKKISAR